MFNSDLNNALTRANSDLIAGYGLPSNNYDTLTIGASGAEYTAPANGYFWIFAVTSTNTSFAGFTNTTNGVNFTQQVAGSGTGAGYSAFMPAKKGDVVKIGYANINGNHPDFYLRFYYCEGEPANV
jgi:hypothetical protein